MTGYENSPDYGGGDGPPRWLTILVVVAIGAAIVGVIWWRSQQ